MTEVEAGWFVISLLVAIILPVLHMIFALVTLHAGLRHGRLSHTWWAGIAFGPFGPLVVRLLPPDDPDWLRDELEAAFSGGKQTGMRFTSGMFITMIVPGCVYYLLIYFLLSGGLPFIWWAVPLVMLLALHAGWLLLKGTYPLPVNFPAPVVLEPGGAGRPPVVVFDHRVLQVSLRSKLLHVTGYTCVLYGIFDLLYVLICFTADGSVDFTPHRPWAIMILVLLIAGAVACFIGSKRALRRFDDPECAAGLAVCYFCGRPVLPGRSWVLRSGTLQVRHDDCPDLIPGEVEDVPDWVEGAMHRRLQSTTATDHPCRVCGGDIDPGYDPYRICPECHLVYHLACYGEERICTHCYFHANQPYIADLLSTRYEGTEREEYNRRLLPGYGRRYSTQLFTNQLICRSCLEPLKRPDSLARCGHCRRLFHTACMAGGGLCHQCAAGRKPDRLMERYCVAAENWLTGGSMYGDPVQCPECGAISDLSEWIIDDCPACGADMAYMEPVIRVTPAEMGIDVRESTSIAGWDDDAREEDDDWEEDGEPWEDHTSDSEERHGWVENPNWCCACFPAPILFFACLMTFNKYLPYPWSDILLGLGITSLALALVVSGVMWVVNRVRARLWPMPEPSPLKSVLTPVRTVLYWLAGAATVVGLTLLGSEVAPVLAATLLVFAGITLALAILVSLFCLFIR